MNELPYAKNIVTDTKPYSPEDLAKIEALRAKLPRRYWLEINDLLVSYGQTVCRPISPLCSRCTIARWCARKGVGTSR